MIHVNDREVDLLAESGTNVVHCPAAGIKRAYGAARFAKFPEMLGKGVPVSSDATRPTGPTPWT